MVTNNVFHSEHREAPYWWDAYEPVNFPRHDVPAKTRVAIVGAGYAGLSCALELNKQGIEAVVLDAGDPGNGASTRSGGMVGGTASVKTPIIGKQPPEDLKNRMISDAADGLRLLEQLIEEENIDCGWTKTGRFTGAWSREHFRSMSLTADRLNRICNAGARAVPREQQRAEIGSDFYHGGLVIGEAGHLHPALYFKGLLNACCRRNIVICAHAPVTRLRQQDRGWLVETSRGPLAADEVVIATNGYTGDVTPQFKRRLVPLRPYTIATEEIPADLAASLSPVNRSFSDSKRIITFYRLSTERNRLIFGSRVKWTDITPSEMAPYLHELMVDRFPQLADIRITHSWTGNVALTLDEQPHAGALDGLHYALGCNGSGVAMMTYLGNQVARKIAHATNYACAFDNGSFPAHKLYSGNVRWFLPPIGNYLRFRDWIDRRFN